LGAAIKDHIETEILGSGLPNRKRRQLYQAVSHNEDELEQPNISDKGRDTVGQRKFIGDCLLQFSIALGWLATAILALAFQ